MDKQERLNKIIDGFDVLYKDFLAKPKEVIPFSFQYTGDETIHCIAVNCSCTKATLDRETQTVSGKLTLFDVDHYKRKHPNGNTVQEKKFVRVYFDPEIPLHFITEDGILIPHPDKPTMSLELRGFVTDIE